MRRYAFEKQDKVVLEAQQRQIGDRDLFELNPALLSVDAASIKMRRLMSRLIAGEA